MDTNTKQKINSFIFCLLALSLFTTPAKASDKAECGDRLTLFELTKMVNYTRSTYFKQISANNIQLESFNSSEVYFQTQPVIKSLIGNTFFRKYKLQYNPKVFSCPPSRKAIQAILVHEFEHINDYFKSSVKELINFGIKYALLPNYKAKYERATDVKACKKGFAQGLIEYREWIYTQLTPKQLKKKQEIYLTPEELRDYL